MSREDVEHALGAELKSQEPHAGADGCEYVRPQTGSNHVGFMFLQRHLARINVSDPAVLTTSGAHVGSTKGSILRLYPGRVDTSPHDYTAPEGEYLTVLSRERKYGIRFETYNGKVTLFCAGTARAIRYPEGCS